MTVVFKGLHCSYWMPCLLPFKNKQETSGTQTAVPCIKKRKEKKWAKSTLLAQD